MPQSAKAIEHEISRLRKYKDITPDRLMPFGFHLHTIIDAQIRVLSTPFTLSAILEEFDAPAIQSFAITAWAWKEDPGHYTSPVGWWLTEGMDDEYGWM